MNIKSTGMNADLLKREAKKLSKASQIPHTEALNLLAKKHGFESWEHLINNRPSTPKSKKVTRRPVVPVPPVLNYHNTMTGAVIGQHPNRKMSVRRHQKIGGLLRELLDEVEYHKRAKNAISEIRRTMDNWLACEYDENALDNATFNHIYYRNGRLINEARPSHKRQAELRQILRTVKGVLHAGYHDCKPLAKLEDKFDQALKALEKWPKELKVPGQHKRRIPSGTFVRVDGSKQIAMVFHHNTYTKVVEGYTDAGRFLAGRHEVTVMRNQPAIEDFKPMRLYMPYGKWMCSDGREVLFNRDYSPIWQKSPSGIITGIQPDSKVDYDDREFYYDDRTAPYYGNKDTFYECTTILKEWGVVEKLPPVFKLFQQAIAAGDLGLLSPKGIS